jgi:iron complex transport system permease protein
VSRLLVAYRLRRARDTATGSTWAALLALLVLAAMAWSVSTGAARLPLGELPGAALDATHPLHAMLRDVRLPRIAAGLFVGAALSVAGALLQTAVRNPLADPGLVGVTAGAGVGALVAIVLAPEWTLLLPLFAFAGSAAALAAVVAAAAPGGRAGTPQRLLLSGMAVQALLFSVIALLTFLFADRAPAFVAFTVGSLAGSGWREVALCAALTGAGLALALASARTFDLLLLDDDTAHGVGLSVARARLAAAALAALLGAGAVSVAGLVGFVGLVVPNAVRLAAGPRHVRLLPLSALGGAALVVAADTVARTAAMPLELPVGALLALIGGPYFLYVLWRKVA